jgi:hypothetical protein
MPQPWVDFLNYMNTRLDIQKELGADVTAVSVPLSQTMVWASSWKKYMVEMMYTNDLYMIYPNFPRQISLSTNHVELGEHIGSAEERASRVADYTVPLLSAETSRELIEKHGIADPLKVPETLQGVQSMDMFSRLIAEPSCLTELNCLKKYKSPHWRHPNNFANDLFHGARRDSLCLQSIGTHKLP